MLGAIVGAVSALGASGGGDVAKSLFNAKEARQADKRSYYYWKKMTLNGPSFQRQGLEDAGFNPLLAINGGLGSFSMPTSHAASSSGVSDFVGSAKEGSAMMNDILKAFDDKHEESDAQTELLKSEADAKRIHAENDTLRTLSDIEKNSADTELKRSQNTKTKVDTIAEPVGDLGRLGLGLSSAYLAKKYGKRLSPVVKKLAPLVKHIPKVVSPVVALPLAVGAAGGLGWKAGQKGSGKKVLEIQSQMPRLR